VLPNLPGFVMVFPSVVVLCFLLHRKTKNTRSAKITNVKTPPVTINTSFIVGIGLLFFPDARFLAPTVSDLTVLEVELTPSAEISNKIGFNK
jgi:hypothetical protein